MSRVPYWSEATLTEIRHMRDAGKSWVEVGDALQICPKAAQSLGKRMGLTHPPAQRRANPRPPRPRTVAETQPAQRSAAELAGTRQTLPPGATWALLTAGTCLDGQPYPETVTRLV
ncbi:MAG: hypothetical protein ACRYG8_42930 [Janthinobacterium lividum]